MLRLLKIRNTALAACLLWLFYGVLAAEFVTPAQALDSSGKWISHFQPDTASPLKQMQAYQDGQFLPIPERRVYSGDDGLPELYFVRFADDTFAILPADDNFPPILAYSTEPGRVGETLPPAFYALMEAYAANVRHGRATGTARPGQQRLWQQLAAGDFSFLDVTREVRPLIEVSWNQSWPYNELCPADPAGPGGHVYAGCMAVAMAQLLKYWNRPIQGIGSNSYICQLHGYQSVNFGETTYQWDQMPPALQAPNLAVATLLYHCGVSMNMQYSYAGSGANWYAGLDGLRNHFGFPEATSLERNNCSDSQWTDTLKEQLDQGIPLWFGGSDPTMNHAFNLDGYQAGDYFHVNFGWGGSGDGYYNIDAINYLSYSLNTDQRAIINAVPQGYTVDGARIKLGAHDAQITHPITVSISTDPILSSWGVYSYSLSISYPCEGLQFDGAETVGTMSEGGNILVNSPEPGLLQVSWTGANPLVGGGSLLKLIFVGRETGTYLIRPVAAEYAGVSVNDLGTATANVFSTIDSPAGSSLQLSNALGVDYGETATLNLLTSYLPPSWNITHYEFDLAFPPDKITFSEVQTSQTLSAWATGVLAKLQGPGSLRVSVDSDEPITGLADLLLKVCFTAVGNDSSLVVAQVQLNNFFYNGFAVPGTVNAVVSLAPVSAVSEGFPETPLQICAYPNPFKTGTEIKLAQTKQAPLTLEIYNLRGQKVYSLFEGILPEGNHSFTWRGRDQAGNALGPGIYFLRAKTPNSLQTNKLILIR